MAHSVPVDPFTAMLTKKGGPGKLSTSSYHEKLLERAKEYENVLRVESRTLSYKPKHEDLFNPRVDVRKDDWLTACDLYNASVELLLHVCADGVLPADLPDPVRRICEIVMAYDTDNGNNLHCELATRRRLLELEEELDASR